MRTFCVVLSVLILLSWFVPAKPQAQTTTLAPVLMLAPGEMNADDLARIVASKLGYQWYTDTRVKAFRPEQIPPSANPWAPVVNSMRPPIFYYDRIEVGITTLFGPDPVASDTAKYTAQGVLILSYDVRPQRVYDALKKAMPQVSWDQ